MSSSDRGLLAKFFAATMQYSAWAPLVNQSFNPKTAGPISKPSVLEPTDSTTPENSWLNTIGNGRGCPEARLKVGNHSDSEGMTTVA